MIHQIHRYRMGRIWSRGIFLGCFSAIWALSGAVALADDGKAAYQRFAVIGSQTVQKSGLSDLIAAELLQAGIELVERDQLNAVVTEQALASALGDDAPAARIRLGALTRADALVLVNEQPDPKRPCIRVIVTECLQGARLSSDFFPLSTAAPQLAHQIADAVAKTRMRFPGGVKTLIGVPPFLSRNFTYEFHSLQSGYSTLLQESLEKVPGVAVVEVEEAQALRREQSVTGGKAVGAAPIFVEGEYEVVREAGKPPSVNFDITLRTESDPQVIRREGMTLADALQFIAGELPGKVLAEDRVVVNSQPFAADKEFTRLVARADSFASLGEWEHAAQLRLAALVIRPDDPKVRDDASIECMLVVRRPIYYVFPGEARRIQILTKSFPLWLAAMESLEWEIRNHPNNRMFARAHSDLSVGAYITRDSSFADAAQQLKRDFLLHAFPLTFLPEWDDPKYKPPPMIISPAGAWLYNDALVRLALIGGSADLKAQDYDLLLTLLNGEIREKVEPSAQLMGLLWGQDHQDQILRGASDDFLGFVQRLESSPRRLNQIIAKLAMVAWNVNHGARVDADLLPQIETLRADYKALVLEKIPLKHLTVMDEVDRIRDLGTGGATTRTAAIAGVADLSDQMEHGPLRLEKLQLRQKYLGAPAGRRPGAARPGFFTVVNCGPSLDVVWSVSSVNLMREPGLLEEIGNSGTRIGDVDLKFAKEEINRRFTDVKWDGERIWIATAQRNVWAVDVQGKVVAQVGPEQGLPPTEQGVLMQPIGPDRVVVVGNTGAENRAFIGLIEKENQAYHFKLIHKATRVFEPRPGVSRTIVNDIDLAFRPEQIGLTRAVDGPTQFVVIRRQASPVGWMLLVNATTLAVSAPDGQIQWASFTQCGQYILRPTWDSRATFWHVNSAGEFSRDPKIPVASNRLGLWHFTTPPTEAGPVYVLGKDWFMVDPIARISYRLAPEGSFGDSNIYGMGWTRFGPIVWLEGPNHILCAYKIVVSTHKLRSLPPSEVFGADPAPATMPAGPPISPPHAIR